MIRNDQLQWRSQFSSQKMLENLQLNYFLRTVKDGKDTVSSEHLDPSCLWLNVVLRCHENYAKETYIQKSLRKCALQWVLLFELLQNSLCRPEMALALADLILKRVR
jgi:hypothetical protein